MAKQQAILSVNVQCFLRPNSEGVFFFNFCSQMLHRLTTLSVTRMDWNKVCDFIC